MFRFCIHYKLLHATRFLLDIIPRTWGIDLIELFHSKILRFFFKRASFFNFLRFWASIHRDHFRKPHQLFSLTFWQRSIVAEINVSPSSSYNNTYIFARTMSSWRSLLKSLGQSVLCDNERLFSNVTPATLGRFLSIKQRKKYEGKLLTVLTMFLLREKVLYLGKEYLFERRKSNLESSKNFLICS